MTFDEYKRAIGQLEEEFNSRRTELMKQFVRANNPHKVGDTVTDHIGTILIEKIGFSWGHLSMPGATYHGVELKKDGSPNKRANKRTVWQTNLISNEPRKEQL